MGIFDMFKKPEETNTVYSTLSLRQKYAAMALMMVFGGSCSGSPYEINKIDHIMSQEGKKMGVTGAQVHSAMSQFSDIDDMVTPLIGANRQALSELFWAHYCIVAVGKQEPAVQMLMGIYNKLGFSDDDCIAILERKTGRKVNSF